MLNRINKFINTQSTNFPNRQQGFQLDLSCLTAAFNLQETVYYNTERQSDIYIARLDQRAAFDTVRFDAMLLKLGRLGLSGAFLRIIQASYTDLKSVVRVASSTSGPFDVVRGVRQGGVVSPFLYLVNVNDLLNDLEASQNGAKVMSVNTENPTFADDILLLALSPTTFRKW